MLLRTIITLGLYLSQSPTWEATVDVKRTQGIEESGTQKLAELYRIFAHVKACVRLTHRMQVCSPAQGIQILTSPCPDTSEMEGALAKSDLIFPSKQFVARAFRVRREPGYQQSAPEKVNNRFRSKSSFD